MVGHRNGCRQTWVLWGRYVEQRNEKGKGKVRRISLIMGSALPAGPIETLQGLEDSVLSGFQGGLTDG
jgi:hypothetical protein